MLEIRLIYNHEAYFIPRNKQTKKKSFHQHEIFCNHQNKSWSLLKERFLINQNLWYDIFTRLYVINQNGLLKRHKQLTVFHRNAM